MQSMSASRRWHWTYLDTTTTLLHNSTILNEDMSEERLMWIKEENEHWIHIIRINGWIFCLMLFHGNIKIFQSYSQSQNPLWRRLCRLLCASEQTTLIVSIFFSAVQWIASLCWSITKFSGLYIYLHVDRCTSMSHETTLLKRSQVAHVIFPVLS